MAALGDWLRRPFDALMEARGLLMPFATVALGLGIFLWFQMPVEPGLAHYGVALVSALVLAALWLAGPVPLRAPAAFLAALRWGFWRRGCAAT